MTENVTQGACLQLGLLPARDVAEAVGRDLADEHRSQAALAYPVRKGTTWPVLSLKTKRM